MLTTQRFFNEFTLRLNRPAGPVVDALAKRGVLAGVPGSRLWPKRRDLADLRIERSADGHITKRRSLPNSERLPGDREHPRARSAVGVARHRVADRSIARPAAA